MTLKTLKQICLFRFSSIQVMVVKFLELNTFDANSKKAIKRFEHLAGFCQA